MMEAHYIRDRELKVGDRVIFLEDYEVGHMYGQVPRGWFGTICELVNLDGVEPYLWVQVDSTWPGYIAEDWKCEEWPERGVQIMDDEMEPGAAPIAKTT